MLLLVVSLMMLLLLLPLPLVLNCPNCCKPLLLLLSRACVTESSSAP
jgi:hypothetical protein